MNIKKLISGDGKLSRQAQLSFRSRGFSAMQALCRDFNIIKFVNSCIRTNRPVRILEIGFGEGRCLLQLRKKFRSSDVELYGINKGPEFSIKKRTDLLRNAKLFNVHISEDELPVVDFYDVSSGLRYESDFFDLVISQTTFFYIKDKAGVIEEIWRVLKPGGRALVHIDGTGLKYDDYENYPDVIKKNRETPRFVIYKSGKLKKLSQHLGEIRRRGFNIRLISAGEGYCTRALLVNKNISRRLNLALTFDTKASFDLNGYAHVRKKINSRQDVCAWNGHLSVYRTQ